MSRLTVSRVLRAVAVWLAPLFAAAVVTASGAQFAPWSAKMYDFSAYRRTAELLLHRQDFYAADPTLPFIYPPFAALLLLPTAIHPLWLAQVGWTLLSTALLLVALWQTGLRGWRLSLGTAALILFADPIRSTLYLGQINLVVTGLVLLDLAPGIAALHRRLPTGVLTGIATAIKLTPAVFIVCLFLAGRRKAAYTAAASFLAASLLGALILPGPSWTFWRGLASGGGSGVHNGVVYFTNQSVIGTYVRWFGHRPDDVSKLALALALLVLLLTVAVTVLWARLGESALAIGLCGLGSLLASPIAWDHHFIWAVPLGLVALERRHLPSALRACLLAVAVWILAAPYMSLPGDGYREFTFTFIQKLVDSMSALLGVAALACALVVALRERRSERGELAGATRVTPPAERGASRA